MVNLKNGFHTTNYLNIQKMPQTMIWVWINNFLSSDPSLDTKVLWLHQIQLGNAANILFKWNGRLGRSLMNPSPSLLLMIQSPVQHVPKRMIYLRWKAGIGLGTFPRKIKSLQSNKQSKIRQVRRSPTYMFGYLIPRNYMEAMQFDSENKHSKWYDAIKIEMESMLEYKVFKKWDKAILDKHKKVMNSPKGYHRIKAHLVFAVKFDDRHKARLVADGHLTPEPVENIYSGVVSLRNLRVVIFLCRLNNLDLWGADIRNAYLEAFTDEKLYIVAGPEF